MSCLTRINTPRKQGGLGPMKIPLLSDLTHQIAKDYGVYLEDQGHTLRCLLLFVFFGVWVTVDSLMSTTMDQLTYCKLCDCLSGDFSSSMTKASWGKSLWTIFLWGDLWMRLCDWCRPSSTQTNMAKVRNSSYFLCTCLHTWRDFFSHPVCIYTSNKNILTIW